MKNCEVRYDFVYEMITNFILDENIELPVMNIKELCKRLGISVLSDKELKFKYNIDYCRMVNSDDGAAIYLSDDDEYVIVYNSKVTTKRRITFTIGHELAHIILGHFDYSLITYETKEKEAEYGSMILLMHPLLLFRNAPTSYKQVQLQCRVTSQAAQAGFNNYINFCKYHNFNEYDLRLLLMIDEQINSQNQGKSGGAPCFFESNM